MKRAIDYEWWLMVISAVVGAALLLDLVISSSMAPLILSNGAIALLIWVYVNNKKTAKAERRCLICGYVGPMGTVLWSNKGGCLTVILFFAAVVPAVMYVIWRWNTPVCPRCKAIGKATYNL